MNQVMNVEFLNDNTVNIQYKGKINHDLKENLLNSLKYDIARKGYIVENKIHRQDIGNFIYYQFYYFDETNSRNVQIQVPKSDLNSIHFMDQVLSEIENEKELPDIIFEDEKNDSKL